MNVRKLLLLLRCYTLRANPTFAMLFSNSMCHSFSFEASSDTLRSVEKSKDLGFKATRPTIPFVEDDATFVFG
ncbi:unnamed protein product, partial [Ilex paraguariensis]